jgi:hypothetical protein
MIHEQVKCDVHGLYMYCMWDLNQEPELPVPVQVCQPCHSVCPCTKIYHTSLMFNSRPLYKHYGLWWKFQSSGQHFTCSASHVCHLHAHKDPLLFSCKWNMFFVQCVRFIHIITVCRNFSAVS